MCDIPKKDLRIHTVRYGKYGIAFHKNKAIQLGHFNPVLYVHKDSFIFQRASVMLPEIDKLIGAHDELEGKITEFLALLGTFIKRSDLTAPITVGNVQLDKEQNNNFYYEREWRSAFKWQFELSSVAAIMIPQKDFEAVRLLLDSQGFKDTPVIPYEMVDKL